MEFKLIIAGGRDFNDRQLLADSLDVLAYGELSIDYEVSIVSGMARGADRLGYEFARLNNIQTYTFPANWHKYGKRAGYLRNAEMGNFADGLLVFWDGKSRGTQHMIDYMMKLNKPVTIVRY